MQESRSSPHMIFGALARGSATWPAANWIRYNSCFSIQTTERYLGGKQKLRDAVNDRMGIESEANR